MPEPKISPVEILPGLPSVMVKRSTSGTASPASMGMGGREVVRAKPARPPEQQQRGIQDIQDHCFRIPEEPALIFFRIPENSYKSERSRLATLALRPYYS